MEGGENVGGGEGEWGRQAGGHWDTLREGLQQTGTTPDQGKIQKEIS